MLGPLESEIPGQPLIFLKMPPTWGFPTDVPKWITDLSPWGQNLGSRFRPGAILSLHPSVLNKYIYFCMYHDVKQVGKHLPAPTIQFPQKGGESWASLGYSLSI